MISFVYARVEKKSITVKNRFCVFRNEGRRGKNIVKNNSELLLVSLIILDS